MDEEKKPVRPSVGRAARGKAEKFNYGLLFESRGIEQIHTPVGNKDEIHLKREGWQRGV